MRTKFDLVGGLLFQLRRNAEGAFEDLDVTWTIMSGWFKSITADAQVGLITFIGAAVAFLIGLLQYRQSQRWKRSEWVAGEMEKFFADPAVGSALKMIDYGARRVALYLEAIDQERYDDVADDEVALALQPHDIRGAFSPKETAIRDIFDRFLERLERIYSFLRAGLVSAADVRPYLAYWAAHILSARLGDPKVDRLVALRVFIARYEYTGVQRLFLRVAWQPFWKRGRFFDWQSSAIAEYLRAIQQRSTTSFEQAPPQSAMSAQTEPLP